MIESKSENKELKRAMNYALRGIFRFRSNPDLGLVREANRLFGMSQADVTRVFREPESVPACEIYDVVSIMGFDARMEAEKVNFCMFVALNHGGRWPYANYLLARMRLWFFEHRRDAIASMALISSIRFLFDSALGEVVCSVIAIAISLLAVPFFTRRQRWN